MFSSSIAGLSVSVFSAVCIAGTAFGQSFCTMNPSAIFVAFSVFSTFSAGLAQLSSSNANINIIIFFIYVVFVFGFK